MRQGLDEMAMAIARPGRGALGGLMAAKEGGDVRDVAAQAEQQSAGRCDIELRWQADGSTTLLRAKDVPRRLRPPRKITSNPLRCLWFLDLH